MRPPFVRPPFELGAVFGKSEPEMSKGIRHQATGYRLVTLTADRIGIDPLRRVLSAVSLQLSAFCFRLTADSCLHTGSCPSQSAARPETCSLMPSSAEWLILFENRHRVDIP